jgi:hypothetical protein
MIKNIFNPLGSLKILLVLLILMAQACGSKQSAEDKKVSMDDVFSEINSNISDNNNAHSHEEESTTTKIGIVKEVLNTTRYSYLELEGDGNENYWIAISKQAVEIGDQIMFQDGILKKNFESKEFNRVFETIYLVSRFQRITSGQNNSAGKVDDKTITGNNNPSVNGTDNAEQFKPKEGEVSIAAILSAPQDYNEKTVKVSGKVFKVNYNIMGKNWVHIRQNSGSNKQELTITTSEQVMENQDVTFEGHINLNRDFGAGYVYDVIMEDARKL